MNLENIKLEMTAYIEREIIMKFNSIIYKHDNNILILFNFLLFYNI